MDILYLQLALVAGLDVLLFVIIGRAVSKGASND
jgi:hypothetical protein